MIAQKIGNLGFRPFSPFYRGLRFDQDVRVNRGRVLGIIITKRRNKLELDEARLEHRFNTRYIGKSTGVTTAEVIRTRAVVLFFHL
ncbi:uncharacterized protein VTP21DRAFT_11326 [Calcarisporiella thermophila]|uniref:uncharacterized protein n=1 Tax=Calcarisporiella thermophila TaxID=911321 RepID=UPI003743205B